MTTETKVTVLTPELADHLERLSPADKDRAIGLLGGHEYDLTDAERASLKAELTRRWERLRSGEDKSYTIEEVMAALRVQNEARRA
jgi:hypothetical protein